MEIRFKKIKARKDGKLRLEYEVNNNGKWDEYTLNCSDEPKAAYTEAMAALAQDVIEMCELPVDYKDRITVTGVSFSHGGEKEVMGAVITAQMNLRHSNQPLNLNTPHKAEEYYGETGDALQLLDEACVRRLTILQEEAEDYVNGTRAQVEMFPEVA